MAVTFIDGWYQCVMKAYRIRDAEAMSLAAAFSTGYFAQV